MSLDEVLGRLVEQSKKVASLELTSSDADYTAVHAGMKRPLIRDAESNESKLFAVSTSETLSAKIQTDLQGAQSLQRILSVANTLNQLCNRPELKDKIESLAQKQEEHQMNIDYLRSRLQNFEKESSLRHGALQVQDRSEVHELETAELRRKEREIRELQDDIESRSAVHEKQKTKISGLEERIATQKKRLQSLEAQWPASYNAHRTHGTTEASTTQRHSQSVASSTTDLFSSLRLQYERLVDEGKKGGEDDATLRKDLIALLDQASETLQDTTEDANKYKIHVERGDMMNRLEQGLLDYVLSSSNQEDASQDTNDVLADWFPEATLPVSLSKQAIITATVLQTVAAEHEHGGIHMPALKTKIAEVAKSIGLDEKAATQAIYKLVANNVIMIDRSSNASVVKSTLTDLLQKS